MEFRILGSVEASGPRGGIALGGPRHRVLLATLLMCPGRVVSAERLIEAQWGETPPRRALEMLHVRISELRKMLRAGSDDGSDLIVTRRPGYLLDVTSDQVDALRFERLAEGGRRALAAGDAASASEQLSTALALWRGPALADIADRAFAQPAIARLENLRVQAVEDRISADLEAGRQRDVVAELEGLVRAQPLHERYRVQLMLALYREGRQSDALEVYQQVAERLRDELGVDPGAELQELRLSILRQDPALRAPRVPGPHGVRPTHLPAPLTSFVGRETELEDIDTQLTRARLVTLTGAGGSGKTRLAIELARRRAAGDAHPDGVWFVELRGLREGDLVPDAVATALGLRLPAGRPGVAATVAGLRAWRALVVLDNCEHLIEPVAALAGALLAGCPDVTLLATSREPLRVSGEVIWRVPPLQLPGAAPPADLARLGQLESVRLFVERTRAVMPAFVLDATTGPHVAQICRRLDGIPLALELAAARLAHLSMAELAARLDDALGLLSYTSPGRSDRGVTLAATIDWSHDLLTNDERALFRRLSVFAGGFALDAAEALGAGVVADPVGTLSRLIDRSLVVTDTSGTVGRYRLLEVIRQYAAARLRPDEGPDCRRRHRDHYTQRAVLADPERTSSAVDAPPRWHDLEHDNLRAALAAALAEDPKQALRLAASMWRFWVARGMAAEGVRWLRRALDAHPQPCKDRAAALYGLAVLHTRLGEAAPLAGISAELVEVARADGGPYTLAEAHHHQTVLALMANDWRQTDALAARTLAEATEAPAVLTSAHHLSAVLALCRGEPDGTREHLDAAGAALKRVPRDAAPFFVTLSPAILVEHRAGWSCPIVEETLFLARRVGPEQAGGHLKLSAALHARLCGDLDAALRLLSQASATFRGLGDRHGEALALAQRGHALRWGNDLAGSRACFERAESIRRELGELRGIALTLDGQALAEATAGRAQPARALAEHAVTGMRRCGDVAGTGQTWWNLAVVEVLLGDLRTAEAHLASPPVDETAPGWHRAVGWYQLLHADVLRRLGDHPEPALHRARRLFASMGERAGLAELHTRSTKRVQSRLAQ